jgi:hypothetical protein
MSENSLDITVGVSSADRIDLRFEGEVDWDEAGFDDQFQLDLDRAEFLYNELGNAIQRLKTRLSRKQEKELQQ